MDKVVDFLYEAGTLARIPRSGSAFLGSGAQSIAEHSYRVTVLGFALARLVPEAIDELKLLRLCLFHDLHEARVGDANRLQQRYTRIDLDHVLADIGGASPLGDEVARYIRQFEEEDSMEAKLARDADVLELMLFLKETLDTGNPRAKEWLDAAEPRVSLPVAKQLAARIREVPADRWWRSILDPGARSKSDG